MPYADPEQSLESRRRWRAEHKKQNAAAARAYRARYPERIQEANRRYREKNPEKMKILRREWRINNPEKYRASIQRSAARRKERMRKDADYAMRRLAYFRARSALTRKKIATGGLPAWLAGSKPQWTGAVRTHYAETTAC